MKRPTTWLLSWLFLQGSLVAATELQDSAAPLTFTFDMGLVGIGPGCEWRYAKNFSLKASVEYIGYLEGIEGILEGSASDITATLRGEGGLEPRYYYNVNKVLTGRRKASKYLAIRLQYRSAIGATFIDRISVKRLADFQYRDKSIPFHNIDLVPTWGLRSEQSRIYFEFSGGYIVKVKNILKDEIMTADRIRIVCRVGFRF